MSLASRSPHNDSARRGPDHADERRVPVLPPRGVAVTALTRKFNSVVPWPVRLLLVAGVAALILYSGALTGVVVTTWAISLKAQGHAPHCPWIRVLTFYSDMNRFGNRTLFHRARMKVESYDEQFGIELISHATRSYWIRRQGGFKGFDLLAYHLAEHDWMRSRDLVKDLRESDIVIDCGAHVGVFVNKALMLGAGKVIAIDPDPIQVECLRRNFSREIAEGRVVVVPKAVWSSEGRMTLHVGGTHSGVSSLTGDTGGEQLEVAVTTIDALVAELNLARVDFIKLDIEGAEREALKGAAVTLKKHRPSNHDRYLPSG